MLRGPIGEAEMADYAMKLTTRYDGMVVATFPDLPGVSALGIDDEDARSEAQRALAAALAEQEVRPEPELA
jgi:predicted RNase H-like HicB family nuclease